MTRQAYTAAGGPLYPQRSSRAVFQIDPTPVLDDIITPPPPPPPPPAATFFDHYDQPVNTPVPAGTFYHLATAGGQMPQAGATDFIRNSYHDGASNLVIKGIKENYNYPGFGLVQYTTAWLESYGLLQFTYGDVEARIQSTNSTGIWPSLFLLGSDFYPGSNWPTCGEVDLFERSGPTLTWSTLHGPQAGNANGYSLPFTSGFPLDTNWHIYKLHWEPNLMQVIIDGALRAQWTPASLPAGSTWVFNAPHEMFLVYELSILANPPASTTFPVTVLMDYLSYTEL